MAESLPPVESPQGQWVDLYSSTGIAVGTQLIVQNIGGNNARLSESLSEPASDNYGYFKIQKNEFLTNNAGAIGAWSYSPAGTILQVEEA